LSDTLDERAEIERARNLRVAWIGSGRRGRWASSNTLIVMAWCGGTLTYGSGIRLLVLAVIVPLILLGEYFGWFR
jgi:hypothetical protein